MTDNYEKNEPSKKVKSKQPLNGVQKVLFAIFCWGVQSWCYAGNFKVNGFDQKYIDAKKAMHTGLVIYGLGIIMFILFFYINRH